MSKVKKKTRFATVNEPKKVNIIEERKAPNTNKATKLWMSCFTDYLEEKELPKLNELDIQNLPEILENFYSEVRKKERKDNPEPAQHEDDARLYKNTTLKAIRGALARHFKETHSIDIISGERFLWANAVFEGMQKINKAKGKGNIISKPPMDDSDLAKITQYFKEGMGGPLNPALLQEICLFYVVLYMCRRG